jgi:hypothetical protein
MRLHKFVFKSHKWLAVGAALATVLWFASGVVMLIPTGGPAPQSTGHVACQPCNTDYKAVTVTLPQAVAAVETAAGETVEVSGIDFRRFERQLHYRVVTRNAGVYFVHALTGHAWRVDADQARRIMVMNGLSADRLGTPLLLTGYTWAYQGGSLPAWQVPVAGDATAYYVLAGDGTLERISRLGWWKRFIIGWHTFDFLNPLMSRQNAALWMLLFGATGSLMVLFGVWILWMQWRNWLAARRA